MNMEDESLAEEIADNDLSELWDTDFYAEAMKAASSEMDLFGLLEITPQSSASDVILVDRLIAEASMEVMNQLQSSGSHSSLPPPSYSFPPTLRTETSPTETIPPGEVESNGPHGVKTDHSYCSLTTGGQMVEKENDTDEDFFPAVPIKDVETSKPFFAKAEPLGGDDSSLFTQEETAMRGAVNDVVVKTENDCSSSTGNDVSDDDMDDSDDSSDESSDESPFEETKSILEPILLPNSFWDDRECFDISEMIRSQEQSGELFSAVEATMGEKKGVEEARTKPPTAPPPPKHRYINGIPKVGVVQAFHHQNNVKEERKSLPFSTHLQSQGARRLVPRPKLSLPMLSAGPSHRQTKHLATINAQCLKESTSNKALEGHSRRIEAEKRLKVPEYTFVKTSDGAQRRTGPVLSTSMENDFSLPPTPPSYSSSDSDCSGLSPTQGGDLSPPRTPPLYETLVPQFCSQRKSAPKLGGSIRHPIHTPLISSQPKGATGTLMLTEEEKRTLVSEGYPVPTKLPLTKAEEKSLKKIRRKIKNKISAQESRRKKKEYMDQLEHKVNDLVDQNRNYRRRLDALTTANLRLTSELQSLKDLVNRQEQNTSRTSAIAELL